MALIAHRDGVEECPLLGVKRTSKSKSVTSAFDPSRTSGVRAADDPGKFKKFLFTVAHRQQ